MITIQIMIKFGILIIVTFSVILQSWLAICKGEGNMEYSAKTSAQYPKSLVNISHAQVGIRTRALVKDSL